MSINLFADRKMAMGFAGSIMVVAILAGASMGAFTPRGEEEDQPQQVERVAAAEAPPSRTIVANQPGTDWEDDELSDEEDGDDWGGSGNIASASAREGRVSEVETGSPEFGNYTPRTDRARTAGRQTAVPSGSGPVIRSRAAADAPAIRAPGIGTDKPRLRVTG